MKNLFMTLVVLNVLCFSSSIYTQNNSYRLSIDAADNLTNLTYSNRLSFGGIIKIDMLENNNLIPCFSHPSLLANQVNMDIISKEPQPKNRKEIVRDASVLPAQYFGGIATVFLHPFISVFFVLNKKETSISCTPPDCATQWNGNN